LGLQFALEGVKRGEEVLFINFQENPAQLRRAIAGLGFDPEAAQASGLKLLYASPVELQIDSIVVQIFDAIKSGSIRRLVSDAVGDLSHAASDPQRLHDYLYSLIQHLAVRGVTTVLTLESWEGFTSQVEHHQQFSYMSDNLIFLAWRADNPDRRTMRIVKMRGSTHDAAVRPVDIDAKGLRVS
jgi:circadian clock protein KaiC